MTTLSKTLLITMVFSALALAQSAPQRSQAKPSSAATGSPASQNAKGQKATAAKGSASHTNNMPGNHKDVMEATAPAPAAGGKTHPATSSATSPAAQPTPAPNRPKK